MIEKMAHMSADEVGMAQTAHFRMDDDINRLLRGMTLSEKGEVLKMIQDHVAKKKGE